MEHFISDFVETLTAVSSVKFTENFTAMIEFNDVTYQQVAEELLRHIGDSDYFSGTVTLTVPEFESRLKTSVIVYRGSSTSDSALRYVEDFVPVWWECHTFTSDGEVVNDFSFSELRNFLVGGGRVHRE